MGHLAGCSARTPSVHWPITVSVWPESDTKFDWQTGSVFSRLRPGTTKLDQNDKIFSICQKFFILFSTNTVLFALFFIFFHVFFQLSALILFRDFGAIQFSYLTYLFLRLPFVDTIISTLCTSGLAISEFWYCWMAMCCHLLTGLSLLMRTHECVHAHRP